MGLEYIYENLKARTGREIAHFFYLNPISSLRVRETCETSPYAQDTTSVPVAADTDMVGMAQSLIETYPAQRYFETHFFPHDKHAIYEIMDELGASLFVGSLDVTYSAFIEMFPIKQRGHELATMVAKKDIMLDQLHRATVETICVPENEERYLHEIDRARFRFDSNAPTVVMVVFGGQGLGKTTFCNRLIQYWLRSNFSKTYFGTANRTKHITRARFLICPLPFPSSASQLLLVEMEGLASSETSEQHMAALQGRVVSAVLAVASVPCFLIKDEQETKRNVAQYLEKFVWLSRNSECKIERILFLFHDKDFNSTQQSENEDIIAWKNELNRIYFNDSPVIILLNKPNFTGKRRYMLRPFLDAVVSEADFPKRSISGNYIAVSDIFEPLRYLGVREEGALDLASDEGEVLGLRYLAKEKKNQLRSMMYSIKFKGESITMLFNENIREFQANLDNIIASK